MLSAVLHTYLISDCGNYCLYPERNNLPDKLAKKRGPDASQLLWLKDDFESILPLGPGTKEFYVEFPVHGFLINGFSCEYPSLIYVYH
jgi:hypothetical protein